MWELVTNYGYGNEVECSYDNYDEAKNDYERYLEEKRKGYLPMLRDIRLRRKKVIA